MSLTLRITSVVGYEGCPAQYFFKEIRRIQTPLAYPILLGSTGHKALEEYNRVLLNTGRPPPFARLRVVLDAAARKNKLKARDCKALTVLLWTYYQRYGTAFKPIAVEERKFLDYDQGCLVTGKTDIVTPDEVIDYKFSRVSRSRKDVATDLQLGFYAHLFNVKLARIVRLNPSGTVSTVGAPAMSPQAVLDRIGVVVDNIRAGRYPPRHTYRWCSKRLCAFWNRCRGKSK